jgi:hypothetical protein
MADVGGKLGDVGDISLLSGCPAEGKSDGLMICKNHKTLSLATGCVNAWGCHGWPTAPYGICCASAAGIPACGRKPL